LFELEGSGEKERNHTSFLLCGVPPDRDGKLKARNGQAEHDWSFLETDYCTQFVYVTVTSVAKVTLLPLHFTQRYNYESIKYVSLEFLSRAFSLVVIAKIIRDRYSMIYRSIQEAGILLYAV